tara:strand:- start:539 stop:712 length:174 start_codon:yes stop_codon:yes gene_type:complete
MYKLKKKYVGASTSTGGYLILLDDVKSSQVESLGLQDYFEKTSESKKPKSTDKENKK